VKIWCFNCLQNTAGKLCVLQQRVTLNCTIIIRGANTPLMSVACLTHVIHVVTNCLVIKDQSLLRTSAVLTGREFDWVRTSASGSNTKNLFLVFS
jgi:hypothetical protein